MQPPIYQKSNFNDFYKKANSASEKRNLTLGLKFKILFSAPTIIIGIAFTLMSTLFSFVFIGMADFSSFKFSDNDKITQGTVTAVIPTNASENDVPVYKFEFEYTQANGTLTKDFCFANGQVFDVGESVNIQYTNHKPPLAKIVDTKKAEFGIFPVFILLPFFVIGLSFLIFPLISRLKAIRILENGIVGKGVLIQKLPTNVSINKRTVYELVFKFTATDGKSYKAIAKSHIPERLEDEQEELLVYLAEKPWEAVLLDTLPRQVKRVMVGYGEQ